MEAGLYLYLVKFGIALHSDSCVLAHCSRMRCLRTCTCTCDMSSLTCLTYIPYIPIMKIARAPLRIGKVKGAPKRPIAIADGAFRGWCLQGNGSPGESRGPRWREERAHKGKLRDKEGCGSSAAKRVHVLQRISAVVVTAPNRPRTACGAPGMVHRAFLPNAGQYDQLPDGVPRHAINSSVAAFSTKASFHEQRARRRRHHLGGKTQPMVRLTPPSAPSVPVLGSLPFIGLGKAAGLGPPPHIRMAQLAEQYGDVMELKMGRAPWVVLSSPSAVHEAFVLKGDAFSGRPMVPSMSISSGGGHTAIKLRM